MKYDIKHEQALLRGVGRLSTHPHIHCSKCNSKTTAFGSNLKGKIQKAGSLEELLNTFECRNCRNAGKPVIVKVNKGVKRKRKSKELRTSELLKHPPKMQFPPRMQINLLENPNVAAEVTAVACQRPDIYLDSGKTCDFCALYEVCKAPCRALSKHGWQAGKAPKKKTKVAA